jgi:hypothetical protein
MRYSFIILSELGNKIIEEARTHIDTPFKHHFKPVNRYEGDGKPSMNAWSEE